MEEGPLGWGRRQEEVMDGWRKGPWTGQEDKLLVEHVRQHGEGRWNSVSKLAGTVSVCVPVWKSIVSVCWLLIIVSSSLYVYLPN